MGKNYTTPAGNVKPREFTVNGTRFECVPSVKAAHLKDLFLALMGDDAGKITWDEHLKGFFAIVMDETQQAIFDKFIHNPENIVHTNLLYQIAQDLYEEYAGVPFGERLDFLTSRLNDGMSSQEESRSKEEASKT